MKKNTTHSWTIKDIKELAQLWKTKSSEDIANEMGLRKEQVMYMAMEIRKVYPKVMPKKHRIGKTRNLITEALG